MGAHKRPTKNCAITISHMEMHLPESSLATILKLNDIFSFILLQESQNLMLVNCPRLN